MLLPGSRITRAFAGLPPPPDMGEINFDWLRQNLVEQILADGLVAPNISSELALQSPLVSDFTVAVLGAVIATLEIPVAAIGVETQEVSLENFGVGRIDGTVFDQERKIGEPSEDSRVSAYYKRLAGPRQPVPSLLSKLLPILLPPARTEFAEVFQLPMTCTHFNAMASNG